LTSTIALTLCGGRPEKGATTYVRSLHYISLFLASFLSHSLLLSPCTVAPDFPTLQPVALGGPAGFRCGHLVATVQVLRSLILRLACHRRHRHLSRYVYLRFAAKTHTAPSGLSRHTASALRTGIILALRAARRCYVCAAFCVAMAAQPAKPACPHQTQHLSTLSTSRLGNLSTAFKTERVYKSPEC